MKKYKHLAMLAILVFTIINMASYAIASEQHYYPARVISTKYLPHPISKTSKIQQATMEITDNRYKGRIVTINHIITSYYGKYGKQIDKVVEPGMDVLLVGDNKLNHLLLYNYIRSKSYSKILWLCGLAILCIAGFKGLRAMLALLLTVSSIFIVFIPLVIKGYPPLATAFGIAIADLILSFVLITGFSRKTAAAIVGTTIGLSLAMLISIIAVKTSFITGLASSEGSRLIYTLANITIDFEGIVLAGILFGALGAIMDVGIEIASSMQEVFAHAPDISFRELFKSGLNIGRDVLGTMINTLVLAYVGASMMYIIYVRASNIPLINVLNQETITIEVIRALAGSLGLMLCIPVTALIAAIFYKKAITN